MTPSIVLASTSPYRRAILDQVGVPYLAASPEYEEDHSLDLAVDDMVTRFAIGKAESLAHAHPDSLIIGADQLAVIDGGILTKPHTVERAVEQLLTLAGRTHRLISALAVHSPRDGRTVHDLSIHHMRMRPLTPALARAYVERDQPLNCAGSYKIESAGLLLFESMAGTDHSAIVGLPLTVVARLLAEFGVDLMARTMAGSE